MEMTLMYSTIIMSLIVGTCSYIIYMKTRKIASITKVESIQLFSLAFLGFLFFAFVQASSIGLLYSLGYGFKYYNYVFYGIIFLIYFTSLTATLFLLMSFLWKEYVNLEVNFKFIKILFKQKKRILISFAFLISIISIFFEYIYHTLMLCLLIFGTIKSMNYYFVNKDRKNPFTQIFFIVFLLSLLSFSAFVVGLFIDMFDIYGNMLISVMFLLTAYGVTKTLK